MNDKPWIGAINRLMRAELRPDPRPKQHRQSPPKYWNGQDLAAAANIRANTLSDVLTGKRAPSVETLLSVAKALGVPVAALLMEQDEALSYTQFRQTHSKTLEAASLEATVRKVIEEQAEAMKAEFIANQTQRVIDRMTEKPVAVPTTTTKDKKKRAS